VNRRSQAGESQDQQPPHPRENEAREHRRLVRAHRRHQQPARPRRRARQHGWPSGSPGTLYEHPSWTTGRSVVRDFCSATEAGVRWALCGWRPRCSFRVWLWGKAVRENAARLRRCTSEPPCTTSSQRTACVRRTRWPFSEPTLTSDPAWSPGFFPTATRESRRWRLRRVARRPGSRAPARDQGCSESAGGRQRSASPSSDGSSSRRRHGLTRIGSGEMAPLKGLSVSRSR
jgi:hypothetical protein